METHCASPSTSHPLGQEGLGLANAAAGAAATMATEAANNKKILALMVPPPPPLRTGYLEVNEMAAASRLLLPISINPAPRGCGFFLTPI